MGQVIKARSIAGVVALTSRTFILQIIAFAATIFLTIFLTPAVFGLFYVVSAIVAFLGILFRRRAGCSTHTKKRTTYPRRFSDNIYHTTDISRYYGVACAFQFFTDWQLVWTR